MRGSEPLIVHDEDRAEAERLKLLSKKEQLAPELIRSAADDAEVSAENRWEDAAGGKALESLKLNPENESRNTQYP